MSDNDSGDSFEVLSDPDEEKESEVLSDPDEEKESEVLKSVSRHPEKFAENPKKLQNQDRVDETECLKMVCEGYKEENHTGNDKMKTKIHCEDLRHKHISCKCDKCVTEHKGTEYPNKGSTLESGEPNNTEDWNLSTDESTLASNKSLTIKESKNDDVGCIVSSDNASLSLSGKNVIPHAVNKITGVKVSNEVEQDFNKNNMERVETVFESSNCTDKHGTNLLISTVPQTNSDCLGEDNQSVHPSDEINTPRSSSDVNAKLKSISSQCDKCFIGDQATKHSKKKQTHETGVQTIEKGWASSTDINSLASNKSDMIKVNNNVGIEGNKTGDDESQGLSGDKEESNVDNTENVLESSKCTIIHDTTSVPRIPLNEGNKNFHSHDKMNALKLDSEVNEQNKRMEDDKIKPETSQKNNHIFCQCDKCLAGKQTTELSKKKQTHEIGVQTTENPTSSPDEKTLESNKLVVVKERVSHIVGVECSATHRYTSASTSGVLSNDDSINEETLAKFLNERNQEFSSNEYRRKLKQNPTSKEKFTSHLFEEPDIKTLGDSIRFFSLSSHLVNLEKSLEDVRRNKIKVEEHQDYFIQTDKEIQKLSFKYHPDKVRNRGGTEEDLEKAQKLQTALNATRTALKILNSAFIDDIGTYHKFEFYTKLSITSVCNEDEMKYRIYEVMCEIGVISRIKQENIISEIRKFLIESRNCIRSYLYEPNNLENHKMYCDSALRHLEGCIQGFRKLCRELMEVKEECKLEKNDRNMRCLLEKLENDSRRDLMVLDLLFKTAKVSLKGRYQIFITSEDMDPYFVLPLVYYTNVILMCSAMSRKESFWENVKSYTKVFPNPLGTIFPDFNFIHSTSEIWKELDHLKNPYYLTAYYTGNMYYENMVVKFICERRCLSGVWHEGEVCKRDIKLEFYYCILQVNEFLEKKFKIQDYNEAVMTNLSMLDFKKCMKIMKEFQKDQEKLSKGIQKFKKKSEKMFEKFDQVLEESRELNQKLREKLEQRLTEEASNAFPDNL